MYKNKKNQYYERRRFTAQERCWRAGGGGTQRTVKYSTVSGIEQMLHYL